MPSSLLAIAGIHLVAVASPGPDTFIVMQTAAKRSRREALFCVLGIACGVSFWATLTLLGLQWLFSRFVWLHRLVMTLGGFYLLWMGFQIIRSCFVPACQKSLTASKSTSSYLKAFTTGLFTNLSNPKAVVYFSSIFSVFIAQEMTGAQVALILSLVFGETLLWFSLVALMLGLPKPKQIFRSLNRWIDGVCGLIFGMFGTALICAAFNA